MPTPNYIWAEPFGNASAFSGYLSLAYPEFAGSPNISHVGRGTGTQKGWCIVGSGSAFLPIDYARMKATPSATAGQGLAFWFGTGLTAGRGYVMQFWEKQGAVTVCHVSIEVDGATGAVVACRGVGGTELYRSTTTNAAYVLPATAISDPLNLVWIECCCTVNGSTGTVHVKVNGVDWINQTGLNTLSTGTGITGVVNRHAIRIDTNTAHTDWVHHDGTGFGGDVRALWCNALAAGFYTAGTPNGAVSNIACVSEFAFDGDLTFVSLDNTGLPKGFSATTVTLPANAVSVQGVIPIAIARKSDAGTNAGRVGLRSGTSEVDNGVDEPVGTGYGVFNTALQQVDPATSAAWTLTGRANSEVFFKRVA